MKHDVVIVGAGHNGLVCGAYLAKAGLKVSVLERRSVIGGAAATEELWPGFKISPAAFVMSLMQPKIIDDLELARFGLEVVAPSPLFQPLPDGRSLVFHDDLQKTCAGIARFSQRDAEAYPAYQAHMRGLAPLMRRLLWETPPDFGAANLRELAKVARFLWRFRGIGRRFYDLYDLLTLSAYDFLRRWFESDVMLATLGSYASGSGGNISLKSPGSAYVLMRGYLRGGAPWGFVRGGMGNIAKAIALSGQRYGLEVRTDAPVARIRVSSGRTEGVVLENGEELRADTVIANASAKTTFLRLIDAKELPSEFLADIRHFRDASSCFKINLIAETLPQYPSFDPSVVGAAYPSAVRIAPSVDYLEQAYDAAKYGGTARRPYLAIMVPSMADETLAPPGKHVISIFGGHASYRLKGRSWTDRDREDLYRSCMETISAYAPGFGNSVIAKQVLTPEDLERIYDLPGGHVHHGELSVDQIFFRRPAPHYADYRTPIQGLYQCGASTHPGGGVTGVPGHNAARAVLRALRRVR